MRIEMVGVEERMQARTVTLGRLIDAVGPLAVTPLDPVARSLAIRAVCADSRRVQGGDLFVAVRGTSADGHDHVLDAIDRGAAAVVAERGAARLGVPFVVVDDSAKSLALIASSFHGDPAADMRLCGVTGTNGKTSTTHILRSILKAGGRTVGLIGTLGHGVDTLVKDPHTTPDAITLHSWFAHMRDQHCFGVVMEVSSHAVRQHRTWGVDFEVGILTNVTHDHLDFHGSMADYRAAKAEFCNSLVAGTRRKPAGTLVYWADDPIAREIGADFAGRKMAVGAGPGADCTVRDVAISLDGTRFVLALPDGTTIDAATSLRGGFVPANAALAMVGAMAMGATALQAREGLAAIDRVPGRFEALGGGTRPVVVIDYAHTPDGFERALATCRGLDPRRLVTVFGCGGDRDRAKRPVMGAIAERMSNRVYLTTDNPRGERVEAIIADIRAGMSVTADVVVELDRARAVATAIAECAPGDLVALLGKGHEEHQLIGDRRVPYSDRDQAEEALAQWRAR